MKTVTLTYVQLAIFALAVLIVSTAASVVGIHLPEIAYIVAVVFGALGLLAAGALAGILLMKHQKETKK